GPVRRSPAAASRGSLRVRRPAPARQAGTLRRDRRRNRSARGAGGPGAGRQGDVRTFGGDGVGGGSSQSDQTSRRNEHIISGPVPIHWSGMRFAEAGRRE